MADPINQKLTPEQEKREKEKKEREKKEEEELKKKLEEKLKLKKEKEIRIAKKKKVEQKRIKKIVNFPFKLLTQITLLISGMSFILLFFGMEKTMLDTIYYTFLIFTMVYIGAGGVMVGIFFLISQDKLAEMEELKKLEQLQSEQEKAKEVQEIERMAEIEREIAAKKIATKRLLEASKAEHANHDISAMSENDYINSVMNENTSSAIENTSEPSHSMDDFDSSSMSNTSFDDDFGMNNSGFDDEFIEVDFSKRRENV